MRIDLQYVYNYNIIRVWSLFDCTWHIEYIVACVFFVVASPIGVCAAWGKKQIPLKLLKRIEKGVSQPVIIILLFR